MKTLLKRWTACVFAALSLSVSVAAETRDPEPNWVARSHAVLKAHIKAYWDDSR